MAQDTRKDPRAKVLTMTVRYKSATVDEFIEHHSHDVSRGGIYIKTPQPFLPGTLLKFEIRIADDKPMLQGVGRVVWKREPASAGPDKPAGMGVKFIKVDEASRALIDRLVQSKGSAISAYDAELPVDANAPAASPPPAPAPRAAPAPVNRAPVGAAPARPAAVAPVGASVRKATMIGLGIDAASATASDSPSAKARAHAPRPAEPMFPRTNSEADMPPPEERTVMKQAAQLLEEALKGAGGSIDEVGSAPLTLDSARPKTSRVEPSNPPPAPQVEDEEDARESPASPPIASTPIPLQKRSSPMPPSPAKETPASAARSAPKPVAAAPITEPPKKKGSGARAAVSLLLVVGAALGAYFIWQKKVPEIAPEPAVTQVAQPAPLPAPVATVAPQPAETAVPAALSASAAAAPVASASASAAAMKPGAPGASASGATAIPAVATPGKPGKPAEPPAAAAPAAEKPAAPAPTEKPAPVVAAPKPKPAPKPAPDEGATPPPEKKPKPAPKPADDNPY